MSWHEAAIRGNQSLGVEEKVSWLSQTQVASWTPTELRVPIVAWRRFLLKTSHQPQAYLGKYQSNGAVH